MKVSLGAYRRHSPKRVGPNLETFPLLFYANQPSLKYLTSSIQNNITNPQPNYEPSFRNKKCSLHEISADYDVKALTPRQMVSLSFELYATGYLDREQYAELAFQAELLPNFDDTIGALTGEKAAPDKPRDYTAFWQDRILFERTHFGDDPRVVQRVESILNILITLDKTAKVNQRRQDSKTENKPTSIPNLPPLSLKRKYY